MRMASSERPLLGKFTGVAKLIAFCFRAAERFDAGDVGVVGICAAQPINA